VAGYRDLILAAIGCTMIPFTRGDGVEAQWRVVEPVLGNAAALYEYEAGTWRPVEAGRLTEPYGGWVNPGPRQSAQMGILWPAASTLSPRV
jgi:glucose-6-phosphate 1-dehydrogenase